jgi:GxxExxY protein
MITTENTEYTENMKEKYPYSDITGIIIKCAIEVHKTLGPGFIESIYEQALIHELKQTGLKIDHQVSAKITYKNINVGEHRLDLLVNDAVIIENKTVKEFDDIHRAQVLSYLKATGKKIGLLINFAKRKIEVKRIIL